MDQIRKLNLTDGGGYVDKVRHLEIARCSVENDVDWDVAAMALRIGPISMVEATDGIWIRQLTSPDLTVRLATNWIAARREAGL